jgi:hypothetical protein
VSMVIVIVMTLLLAGVGCGGIVLVSIAVRREDRRFTLAGDPPGPLSRGARRLTGISRRDYDDDPPLQERTTRPYKNDGDPPLQERR